MLIRLLTKLQSGHTEKKEANQQKSALRSNDLNRDCRMDFSVKR